MNSLMHYINAEMNHHNAWLKGLCYVLGGLIWHEKMKTEECLLIILNKFYL